MLKMLFAVLKSEPNNVLSPLNHAVASARIALPLTKTVTSRAMKVLDIVCTEVSAMQREVPKTARSPSQQNLESEPR
jgi:hypothetical protein